MKPFAQFLNEELNQGEKYSADRMVGSGHSYYRNKFLESHPTAKEAMQNSSGKQNYTMRVPFASTTASKTPDSEVCSFLTQNGYHTTHSGYKDGIAHKTTKVGNPEMGIPMRDKVVDHKIGGLLDRHSASDDIKKKYTNDTFRNGAKTKDYDLVLTGHPHDIYGGSTGRGWDSCAQMRKGEKGYNGPAAQMMSGEINNHTHMVYMVPKGGNVDTDAVGRMSFKHHMGLNTGHETLIPEDRVYGSPPTDFADAAKKLVVSHFEVKSGEVYKKNPNVYNDNFKDFHIGGGGKPSADNLDTMWKSTSPKDERARERLVPMVDHTQKYKSKGLNDVAKAMNVVHNSSLTDDFLTFHDKFRVAMRNIPERSHYDMITGDTSVNDSLHRGVAKFDLSNESHRNVVSRFTKSYGDPDAILTERVAKHIGGAKTVQDWEHMHDMHRNGVKFDNYTNTIPIHPEHKMGRNPIDKIVEHFGSNDTLTPTTYRNAYKATTGLNSRSGNIYDHAVHHENSGVAGMSGIISQLATNMHEQALRRPLYDAAPGMNTDVLLGDHFSNMRPSTRTRIASELGVRHIPLMNASKKFHESLAKEKSE